MNCVIFLLYTFAVATLGYIAGVRKATNNITDGLLSALKEMDWKVEQKIDLLNKLMDCIKKWEDKQ